MPTFEVTVQGRGIHVRIDEIDATSFFRLVRVVAVDRARAEAKALSRVAADWSKSPYADRNSGFSPRLRVDSVALLPWWYRFLSVRRGYVFAPDDDPAGAG